MPIPPLIRYTDAITYDRDHGVVQVLDWRAPTGSVIAYKSAEAVARAIEAGEVAADIAPYFAGYGLALVAREWAARPADARRGAIIQAGELLRVTQPDSMPLAALLALTLARADTAALRGNDAEAAVLAFLREQATRADRVAERCGRIAAELLAEHDRVLTCGYAGPALLWMLYVAQNEQAKPVTLLVAPASDRAAAQHTITRARALGIAAEPLGAEVPDHDSVFVAGAEQIALDGAVAAAPGTAHYAALALQTGLPRYILGYAGPDAALASADNLASGYDLIAPAQISAIVTNRGIYRPEMIARHLGDGDGPLDVISLTLG